MLTSVVRATLLKPPRGADSLLSSSALLAAWRYSGKIQDDCARDYHFALYSLTKGWRAYHWNEQQYGSPWKVLPVSQTIVWAHTDMENLMCLRIEQDDKPAIVASQKGYWLFHANDGGCLFEVQERRIAHLYLREGCMLETAAAFYVSFDPSWGSFLPDGAVVIGNHHVLAVFSPTGEVIHTEGNDGTYFHCPPFITYYDTGCLYYTEDPRQGWHKITVIEANQSRSNANTKPIFFAFTANSCNAIIWHNGITALYRSADDSPDCLQCVGEIETEIWCASAAPYNEMICVASGSPIHGVADLHIPENDGFVAWAPRDNAFYDDIPRSLSILKNVVGKVPYIRIPEVWRKDALRAI